jgi:hypothetical protein
MKSDCWKDSRGRMIHCKGRMTVISLSLLLIKFGEMGNDAVMGTGDSIKLRTMSSLFTPLPDSDSGFLRSNKTLITR